MTFGLALSPDGKLLATRGDNSYSRDIDEFKLWEVGTGKELACFSPRSGRAGALESFTPDGKWLLTTAHRPGKGKHNWVLLAVEGFDVAARKLSRVILLSYGQGTPCAVTPDGKTLIVSSMEAVVVLYDLETGKQVAAFKGAEKMPDGPYPAPDKPNWDYLRNVTSCLALSRDGKWLAVGTHGGGVSVWDLARRRRLWRDDGHDRKTVGLAFSPDGETLVSRGSRGRMVVWERARGHMTVSFRPGGPFPYFVYAPNGKGLLLAGPVGKTGLAFWNPADHTWRGEKRDPPGKPEVGVRGLALSADGSTAAVIDGKAVRLWDVRPMLAPKK
jgi:WD40 repeat protein